MLGCRLAIRTWLGGTQGLALGAFAHSSHQCEASGATSCLSSPGFPGTSPHLPQISAPQSSRRPDRPGSVSRALPAALSTELQRRLGLGVGLLFFFFFGKEICCQAMELWPCFLLPNQDLKARVRLQISFMAEAGARVAGI